jgi:hypothetical protein
MALYLIKHMENFTYVFLYVLWIMVYEGADKYLAL